MTIEHSSAVVEFDEYAESYDAALNEGISISGENKEFFAYGRIAWLAKQLRSLQESPKSVIDYGCGTGVASSLFSDLIGAESIVGTDVSPKALEFARRAYGSRGIKFQLHHEYQPAEENDLAFCNGVFHHIPPDKRPAAIDYIFRSLRPGGLFALWENNPWNPGTRYVMRRIPFDRDAITLRPAETRRLLRAGGFQILRTDFLFIFPAALHRLRYIEPFVSRLPLGAQYQVLCRKP